MHNACLVSVLDAPPWLFHVEAQKPDRNKMISGDVRDRTAEIKPCFNLTVLYFSLFFVEQIWPFHLGKKTQRESSLG
jgi:hypothetical protein